MGLKIRGGITGAGEKQPLAEPRKTPWTCVNGHENPRYAIRCLTLGCNTREEAKAA